MPLTGIIIFSPPQCPSSTQCQGMTTLLSGYRMGWKRGRTAANVGIKMGNYDETDWRRHDAALALAWSEASPEVALPPRRHFSRQDDATNNVVRKRNTSSSCQKRCGTQPEDLSQCNSFVPPLCRRNTFDNQLITAEPGAVFPSCSVFVLHHIPSTQVHILEHFTL